MGKRVKAKGLEQGENLVKTRSIRYYEKSGDTDLEIEAPIESIDSRKSQSSVLSIPVKVSQKTRYEGPLLASASGVLRAPVPVLSFFRQDIRFYF